MPPQAPLILIDNVFDRVNLYPSAVLSSSGAAPGTDVRYIADYRRERTKWQAAVNSNDPNVSVDLGAGSSRAIDSVWIDRGHNLWGLTVRVDASDAADFSTGNGLQWVVPARGTVGGDPTAGWCVTEEGALYTLFVAFAARRYIRVRIAGAPNVANIGTAGATTYRYFVVGVRADGTKTAISAAGVTNTGNAVLGAVNFNRITWAAIPDAATYEVYKTDTGTRLATGVAGLSFDDTGQATAAVAATLGLLTGVIAGARTQLISYSDERDEDGGDRVERSHQSDAGYTATERVYAGRSFNLSLDLIDAPEYDAQIRTLRTLFFEKNQRAVVVANYGTHPARAWLYRLNSRRWSAPMKNAHRKCSIPLVEEGPVIK